MTKDTPYELEQVGATIRRLRMSKGFSQESFADACGLDRTYIGGVERGERNLGLKNLLKIARALGVSPAELLVDVSSDDGDPDAPFS